MKKINILKKLAAFIFAFLYACFTYAVFDYDRAVSCGKQGNWEKAASLFNNVTDDLPDIIYDKGVVAHHQKELAKAKEYFLSAACHPQADGALCERAHFNAGNTCFALKDLESAREQYKKVLALNPDNTFAEHNLKKVEEALKKQQEEQKKEDEKTDEEKKQDEQEEQKNNNQKQQDNQESKNNDKQKQKKEQSSDNGEQKKQSEQGDNEKEAGQEKKSKDEQSKGKQPEQHNEQRDDKGTKDKDAGAGANNKKGQQQKQAALGQQKKDPATHDEWLEGLLAKSDKHDAQGNKKMIKAMVQQQMGGNEGQNCW